MIQPLGTHVSNQQPAQRNTASPGSVLVAIYVSAIIVAWFASRSSEFRHWFIIPVFFCGVLIGIDTIDWLKGRIEIFDPAGIIGLLGYHFFFLAPFLHLYWNVWMGSVEHPDDWREWFGYMAYLNLFGLLIYRVVRNIVGFSQPRQATRGSRIVWDINKEKFYFFIGIALVVSFVGQMLVFARFGGISGYIASAQERTLTSGGEDAFRGMGGIQIITESFPILAMMLFAVYANDKGGKWKSTGALITSLLLFMVIQVLFGGLRGSRSNTILALFWAAGIAHFWIRPITGRLIFGGLIFLVLFMNYYSVWFEKREVDTDEGGSTVEFLSEEEDSDIQRILLVDLGRTDIQAFLLYRMMRPESDYELSWGRAYFGDMAIVLPRSIWKGVFGMERPPHRVMEATNLMYGKGSYIPGIFESPKVYGLAGEALLNFGPAFVPFSFIVLGFAVGLVRRLLHTLDHTDSRILLYPVFVNLCFTILTADLANVLSFTMRDITLPLVIVVISSAWKRPGYADAALSSADDRDNRPLLQSHEVL